MKRSYTLAFALCLILLSGHAWALTINVQQIGHDHCGQGGMIRFGIFGGVAPYEATLNGVTPVNMVSWEYVIENIPAGSHFIMVTDAGGATAQHDFLVEAYSSLTPPGSAWAYPLPYCGGPAGTSIAFNVGLFPDPGSNHIPGSPPLTFSVPFSASPPSVGGSVLNDAYLLEVFGPPLSYPTIAYTDAAGCPGALTTMVASTSVVPDLEILEIVGSCSSFGTGEVTVALSNGNLWECYAVVVVYRTDGTVVNYTPPQFGSGSGYISLPGAVTIRNLPAGDLFVRVQLMPSWFPQPIIDYELLSNWEGCYMDTPFTVPSLGDCGLLTGNVFVDNDGNCLWGPGEPRVAQAIVEILPGSYYTTTDVNGNYRLALPTGSYTVSMEHPVVEGSCTVAPVNISNAVWSTRNIPSTSSVPLDVRVSLASGAARPGFTMNYAIALKNLTPASSGAITVTLETDPLLSFVSADPAPTSISGNTLTWQQGQLFGWAQRNIQVVMQVPADETLLGQDLVTMANVATGNTDGNLANNTATNTRTITGAYDPNDKLAWTSSGNTSEYVPNADDWIDYTIRFQNTGSDTAFHVIITDTLLSTLDPGSIQIGAASHPFTWQLRDQGTLKFYFLNIQLPDSNINEPLSHGFVSFRIKPREPQDLQPGDQLINIANIYFDFNAPVITDPNVLVVPVPEVVLNAKVFLGGAFAGGMNSDALRAQGLIPLAEPYSLLDYPFNGGGGESAQAAVFNATGANAIVDWVVVEVRSSAQPATVIFSRSALLQRDGDVVDLDGVSPVVLSIPAGNYHVAIRHRNHAVVMTATAQSLSMNSPLIDFSSSTATTWGTDARKNINGTMVLWPGDVNFDGDVKYSGAGNDRDIVLQVIGGNVPSNTVNNVYDPADVNMDGIVKYTGADNDRDLILQTIGGVVPTAVRASQIP